VTPQDPPASQTRRGQKWTVHALIDTVFRRQNLELAWEKVKQNRGRAGSDEVTSAALEERQAYYVDLLHRKRREGT